MTALVTEAEQVAEASVVGAALVWPDTIDRVDLDAEHFHGPQWSVAWEAMLALRAEGKSIDELTVSSRVEEAGYGGILPLHRLSEAALAVPTGDNVEHYAEIIRQGHVTRQVMLRLDDVREALRRGKRGDTRPRT